MSDDLTTLASAYLDGDVTPDERARVEASVELLAEVDRLRTVRAVLAEAASADPAPISMRERHLAAALDAWDRLPDSERTGALRDSTPSGADGAAAAGVAAMTSPARRSAKRRRWAQSPGWLGMAAAGLVVVLAGGLVLRNTVSEDNDSADSAVATELSTADAATESAEDGGAGAPAAAPDAPLQEATAAAEAPADTATIGERTEADLDAEAPPAEDGLLEQLETEDDLALFASDAVDAPRSADLPDEATVATDQPSDATDADDEAIMLAELPLCQGADVVVGIAMFGDVRVVVGIDEGRNVAVAYRQDDCSFVARASLS